MSICSVAFAYAASGNVEILRLTELQLLDIVTRSLGGLVSGINMLPFIRTGEKVPCFGSKNMRPKRFDQTRCSFTILEVEDLENGLSNVDIGEFFLEEDMSHPGDKLNCIFNLDRYYILYATAVSENLIDAMGKDSIKD